MKKLWSILFWSVLSAAFIGPGTVATCMAAGAKHQSELLWALIFATLACITLQEAAARMSIASGKTLGEALITKFHWTGNQQWQLWALFLTVTLGCAAYEAGNILGGVAGLQLVVDVPTTGLTLAIVLLAAALLWTGNFKLIARLLGGVVAVMGIAFLFIAVQLELDWPQVALHAVSPSIPQHSGLLVIGLIGTTIVPYNIFLGSGIGKGQSIQEMRFGLSIAILLGGLISVGILLVGTQLTGELSFGAMSRTVEGIAGTTAATILAIGLFSAGLTSAITAPFAAAITGQSLVGKGKWANHSNSFRSVWLIVLFIGGLFGVLAVKPIPIIIAAQALNGLLLPVITYLLVLLVNDRTLVKTYANTRLVNLAMLSVLGISSFLGLLNITKAVYKIMNQEFIATQGILALLIGLSLAIIALALTKITRAGE